LPAKRKNKTNPQEEQTQLLRMILAELQALNASLAASRPPAQAMAEPGTQDDPDSDDEDLEYFE
jgi:hypothetical protein